MAKMVINPNNGKVIRGPANSVTAAEGEQIVDVPLSAQLGDTYWDKARQGFIDAPIVCGQDFLDLLTLAEQDAIFTAMLTPPNAELRRIMFWFMACPRIKLRSAGVGARLQRLQDLGFVTAIRREQIASNTPPAV